MGMSEESRKFRSEPLEDNVTLDDRDDRIDWERKQKGKRRPVEVDESIEDDTMSRVELPQDGSGGNKRKESRKKKRHLVLDEESGRVVVQRRRRRRTHRDGRDFDDIEDE